LIIVPIGIETPVSMNIREIAVNHRRLCVRLIDSNRKGYGLGVIECRFQR
jgi:hypothetical protein